MRRANRRRVDTAVLVSGGLDSAVLLAQLVRSGQTVQPLYVRSGLRWEAAERYWLGRYVGEIADARILRPIELLLPATDLYGAHWSLSNHEAPGYDAPLDSNYLPGRNLLLLSKAAVFCAQAGIDTVALAVLRENPFADGTPAFFHRLAAVARLALGAPFVIATPFRRLSKLHVIRRGRDLPLHLTFSCVQPSGRLHCGICTKCAERQQGFAQAGIRDPTRYHQRRRR